MWKNKIGPIKGNKDRTTSIIYSNWVAGDGLGARGGSKLSIIAVSWLCGKEVIVERTADLIVVRYKKWQVLCWYYRACALVRNRRKTDSDTSVKTNLVSRVLMVGPDPFCYYLVRSLELICRPGIDSLCGSFRFMVRRILRPRNKCAGWLLLLDVWLRLCMYELEIASESTVHARCFCGIPVVFREQCVPVKFPGCWFA